MAFGKADIKVGGEYRYWISDPKSLFRAKVKSFNRRSGMVTFLNVPMFGPSFEKTVPWQQVVEIKKRPKPKPVKKAR